MHAERFFISAEAANKINNAHRVVAVGTTTVRVLNQRNRDAAGFLRKKDQRIFLFIHHIDSGLSIFF
jgi:S-adenosylmethionine:tRNA-ribosyltransferase-isomerase (queuine synthetase)